MGVSGIDIVEMQINIMNNKRLDCQNNIFFSYGHSIETRVYAETPDHKFFPSTGKIDFLHLPGGPFARNIAIRRLNVALHEIIISGCITNISFLLDILTLKKFNDGTYDIKIIDKMNRTYRSSYTIINYLIASTVKFYFVNKSLIN